MPYFNSLIDFRLDKYDLIFQMRKLSLKKMKRPKQITVYKWQNQYLNSDLLPPKHINSLSHVDFVDQKVEGVVVDK